MSSDAVASPVTTAEVLLGLFAILLYVLLCYTSKCYKAERNGKLTEPLQ